EEVLGDILETARWSGSSKNSQPWHFVVVTDAGTRRELAQAGPFAGFLDGAPVVVVIAMAGENPRSEPYDEGRVTERIMLAADAHGLGAGTGWFAPADDGENRVKTMLGVPGGMVARQAIGLGFPAPADSRASAVTCGRQTRDAIVSGEGCGARGHAGSAV